MLTWRDLQHLVIISSRYEPLRHEKGWTTNGVGRKISHKFGYGLMDAEAMVKYAEKWNTVPDQKICETITQNKEREIPAKLKTRLEVSLVTNGCRGATNEVRYLEHVQTKITLKYQPRGSLRISLISPQGTISNLLYPRPRDNEEISFNTWPFLSTHFWGEKPSGSWRLVIQNDGYKPAIVPGKLFSWSLVFYGTFERPMSALNESIRYFARSTSPATIKLNDCMQKGLLKQYDSEDCIKTCPNKQWANYDIGQCLPCNDVCDSCFGPSSDNCLSCAQGSFYEYHCLDKCTEGYFKDELLKECLPCAFNCLSCLDPDSCVQCKPGFSLDPSTQQCTPQNDHTNVFQNCTMNCESCNENICVRCSEDHVLLNGQCKTLIDNSCPDGYYFKTSHSSAECNP